MAALWFAIAAVCIAVGAVLLWRARRPPSEVDDEPGERPERTEPDEPDEPFDLFKEHD
jgi:hypothetical protein